ncbi:MAG: Crp/Fnr family transcriptional regulator [Rhodobacteraceae bacterium]|nr:Crp/Fnr family transcriptional regulator [Paracoccaceae bacterium]
MRQSKAYSADDSFDVAPSQVLGLDGWFARRAPAVQQILMAGAQRRLFDKGAPVYRVGDPADGLHGLISGSFEITVPGDDGVETLVHRADPGFWIGDLALFSEQPRLVSITATTPTETLFLPQPFLRRMIEEHPALLRDFYDLTHQNTALALRLLSNLSVRQSERRLGLRLLHYSELAANDGGWLHLSQDHLASLVAVSLPTLQRILRRFAEEGLVELSYRKLRVRDPERLAALCRD